MRIALSVPGINDAKIIRTPRGAGSIDVFLGFSAGIPPPGVIEKVKEAINNSLLLARDIITKPATAKEQDFSLTFKGKPTISDVRDALRLWLQKRKIGENVTMKALYQEVLASLEIDALEFQAPTQDIEVGTVEKVIPTTIEVTREN